MKIIFLDINGVLNSLESRSRVYNLDNKDEILKGSFDESCLLCLKDLVEKTDSYIVVSSSWRKNVEYYNIFLEVFSNYLSIGRIINTTKTNSNSLRYLEIKDYLMIHSNEISNFVILDDNDNMNDLIDHYVYIDSRYGLGKLECEKAIKILN